MELSFGEQIKILLKRKNMTIQDLAALYEQKTGNKMSRQNLTQRLKRDNFPEQDMHIIAALLGYHVSVQLTPVAVQFPEFVRIEPAAADSGLPIAPASVPSAETTQTAATQALAAQSPEAQNASTQALTAQSPEAQTAATQALTAQSPEAQNAAVQDSAAEDTDSQAADPAASESRTDGSSGFRFQIPELFRRNKPQGDINPLTGEEYLSNTVRRHPDIEEFVQVYDQSTHSWSDVREDYFWEFQEKKKQMLGKDYQAPILI